MSDFHEKTIEAYSIFEEILQIMGEGTSNSKRRLPNTNLGFNPDVAELFYFAEEEPEFERLFTTIHEDEDGELDDDERIGGYYTLYSTQETASNPLDFERFQKALQDIRDTDDKKALREQCDRESLLIKEMRGAEADWRTYEKIEFAKHAKAALAAYADRRVHIKRKKWLNALVEGIEYELDARVRQDSSARDRTLQRILDTKAADRVGEELGVAMSVSSGPEGYIGAAHDADFAWSQSGGLREDANGRPFTESLVLDENGRVIPGKITPLEPARIISSVSGVNIIGYKDEIIDGKQVRVRVLESSSMFRGSPFYGRSVATSGVFDQGSYSIFFGRFEGSNEFEKLKGKYGGSENIKYHTAREAVTKIRRKYKVEGQSYQLDVRETLKSSGIGSSSAGFTEIEKTLEKEARDPERQDELRRRFAEAQLAEED